MVRLPGVPRASGLLLRRNTATAELAQELADKIKRRKVGTDGFFSSREVYLKGWSGLDTPGSRAAGSRNPPGCRMGPDVADASGPSWRTPVSSVRSKSEGVGMSNAAQQPTTRSRWMDWKPKGEYLAHSSVKIELYKTIKTQFCRFCRCHTAGISRDCSSPANRPMAEIACGTGWVEIGRRHG